MIKTQIQVSNLVFTNKIIDNAEKSKLKEIYNELMEIVWILVHILLIYKQVQNEFFKKVFISKNIPNRKPLDSKFKVLTPKKGERFII